MIVRHSHPDVLVAGGGPAGMSAAVGAARRGASVVLVDESPELGGQVYRVPASEDARARSRPHPAGEALRRDVAALGERIEVLRDTSVFGVFEALEVAVTKGNEVFTVRPRKLVIAAGAYEYVPPFPGWTLPGVMTPGAAQIMAKCMGVPPGRRVVVAGTGPFLLVAAGALVRLGVDVAAVLEATPRAAWRRLPLHGWRTPGLLLEGIRLLATLRTAGVPVRYGRIALEAEGDESLRAVRHAAVDGDWNPVAKTEETLEADLLCVGYGFVPRTQLAQMAGCSLELRPDVGGWVPELDEHGMTSVPGVYAAGESAGVAGALVARLEGERCGLALAHELGLVSGAERDAALRPIQRQLARIAPVRAALDRISLLRPGLQRLVRGDTEVCRCEEVSWDEVKDAIQHGGTCYRSLKVMTRVGMGPCQGRFCWPALSLQVAAETGCDLADVGNMSARPPVRPVSLGALASRAGAQ